MNDKEKADYQQEKEVAKGMTPVNTKPSAQDAEKAYLLLSMAHSEAMLEIVSLQDQLQRQTSFWRWLRGLV